jgi:hypothetical protein
MGIRLDKMANDTKLSINILLKSNLTIDAIFDVLSCGFPTNISKDLVPICW